MSGAYRAGAVLFAVVAGLGAGAAVFKVVAEEKIGGEVQTLAARFGVAARPGDSSAFDLLERVAPGTRQGFESAVLGAIVASLLVATVVTVSVREIAS